MPRAVPDRGDVHLGFAELTDQQNATWFHGGNNGWGEIWCPQGASSEHHWIGCERLDSDEPQVSGAGAAYLALSQWLTGSVKNSPCERDDGIWTGGIEQPLLTAGAGRILWAEAGSGRRVSVPHSYHEVWHLDGSTHAITGAEVDVGIKPVLAH